MVLMVLPDPTACKKGLTQVNFVVDLQEVAVRECGGPDNTESAFAHMIWLGSAVSALLGRAVYLMHEAIF